VSRGGILLFRVPRHKRAATPELKRKLEELGCEMEDGTRHWIVTYRGIKTTIPRHPSKEIRTGTFHGIIKKLGIRLK
jgi:mRNA interferase HicA